MFARPVVAAPGEVMEIGSTPLDVMVLLDDGVACYGGSAAARTPWPRPRPGSCPRRCSGLSFRHSLRLRHGLETRLAPQRCPVVTADGDPPGGGVPCAPGTGDLRGPVQLMERQLAPDIGDLDDPVAEPTHCSDLPARLGRRVVLLDYRHFVRGGESTPFRLGRPRAVCPGRPACKAQDVIEDAAHDREIT